MAGDHTEFVRFTRRIMGALSRRFAAADPDDLAELFELQADLDAVVRTAVNGLRETGFSWAEIGRAAGITRQAAQQRWGVKADLTPENQR